jgi:ATP-dependent helicase HrpB
MEELRDELRVRMKTLPIDSYLGAICDAVSQSPITIIEAPPGTGKTTRVAPALMRLTWMQSSRLYLLQPRRIAAKSVADRMSAEQPADRRHEIGYQVRMDSTVSAKTRLIVATEGILVRRLQRDPMIEDTKIVLLDEFHERSLDADLLLGMLRRVQATVRDDLRLVIMSATLDSRWLQTQLQNAPIISVASPSFPVAVRYRPMRPESRLVDHMVQTLEDVVPQHEGDVLAFLPGAGEIDRCKDALMRSGIRKLCDVVTLYGAMSLDDQSRAIEPGTQRRIVLATNIAETSITIEGVRVVVDSGVARVMRFAPDVGLDRLSLESICQASAVQRAGRAGRVAPGVCYRLWSEASDRSRAAFLDPEIRRVDIVSAVLQLFAWGEGDSQDFPWLEAPRPETLANAKQLLSMLGAIEHGRITDVGNAMASMPTHPRLARMLIAATRSGCLGRASLLAALLSEREPFDSRSNSRSAPGGTSVPTRSSRRWDSDSVERLLAIESYLDHKSTQSVFGEIHRGGVHLILQTANQLKSSCEGLRHGLPDEPQATIDAEHSNEALMKVLLYGYPDRLARRRHAGKPHALMTGGKGVCLSNQSGVMDPDLFLCIDIDAGVSGDATVRQASRMELDWLVPEQVTQRDELFFHPTQKQVVARRRTLWFDLILSETPTSIADTTQCTEILLQAAKQQYQIFPLEDESLVGFIARVQCLRVWVPELQLPDIDDALLHSVARELCKTRRSFQELKSAPWLDWLKSQFTSEQLQAIEREAPARIAVPSGNNHKIQYEVGKPPVLAVKIQEVYSMHATPRIANGRIPLLLHLLAPNMRPQQITDDLSSFWKNGYPIVKKELKRRYPKHSWPDDPTTATPGRK